MLTSVIDRLSIAFDAGGPPAAASFAGDRSEITRRVLVVARAEPDGLRALVGAWR